MDTVEPDIAETSTETPEAGSPADKNAEATGTAPATEPGGEETEAAVTYQSVAEWHGKNLVDSEGETIGKLERVYFDVETDEPQFGTVKEGFIGRHLTFVPLTGATIGPDTLQVSVTRGQVKDAPSMGQDGDALSSADESTLYHYYKLNYTPTETTTGQRLARR
jgi:PRC-barrel domain